MNIRLLAPAPKTRLLAQTVELTHQGIIERFGRYPHSDAILGRPSSAEELAFLSEPGSSF